MARPTSPREAMRPTTWLHTGPSCVRMEPPAPGEDATPEAALQRRICYYRSIHAGLRPELRRAALIQGTCVVCGEQPIDRPEDGGFRCAICARAAQIVLDETRVGLEE